MSTAARRYQELTTWQLTEQFKEEVHKLVRESPGAKGNFTFRDQLLNSGGAPSKHVSEGFVRFAPKEFCRFLDYAVSSVAEAENHMRDGIQLMYFSAESCDLAFRLARRCSKAIIKLKHSQVRYLQEQRERQRQEREAARLREARRPRGKGGDETSSESS